MQIFSNPKFSIMSFVLAIVFVCGLAGWIGITYPSTDPNGAPEMGLWLVGPAIAAVVFISLGKWWHKVGIGLNIASSGHFYLVAMAATPAISGMLLLAGTVTGITVFTDLSLAGLVGIAATLVVPTLFKNLFEEFYWRGYLTSRFADTSWSGLRGHLTTGLIWAVWHLPYWLVFLSSEQVMQVSGLPLGGFVAIGFLTLPLQSILYGELRIASGSIWPAFVLHSMSNIITLSFLSGGFIQTQGWLGALLTPGTHGIVYSLALAGIGLALMQQRTGKLS